MPPLVQRIVVDSAGARKGYEDARRGMKQYAGDTRAEMGAVEQKIDSVGNKFKQVLGFAALAIFAKLIGSVKRLTGDMFELGSSVNETGSKYRTVFGEAVGVMDAFIGRNARLMGMTDRMAQDYLSTSGAIVHGMGATKAASADMSEQIISLAGDLQSFSNVPIEEAFGAIRSGIVGQSEPMRRFGIVIMEADVQTRALAMRSKEASGELTDLEKVQARLALMYERAGVALGDLNRTKNEAANRARRVKAEFAQLREEMALGLQPAYEELIRAGERVLGVMKDQGDSLSGKLTNAFIRATQYVVDFGVETGRTGQAVINLIGAINILSDDSAGSLFGRWVDKQLAHMRAFNAMIAATSVLLLEFRAIGSDAGASISGAMGMTEGATGGRAGADSLRARAEAIRQTLRDQRSADNESKRAREEARKQLEELKNQVQATVTPAAAVAGSFKTTAEAAGKAESIIKAFQEAQELLAADRGARNVLMEILEIRKEIADLEKTEASVRGTDQAKQIQAIREEKAERLEMLRSLALQQDKLRTFAEQIRKVGILPINIDAHQAVLLGQQVREIVENAEREAREINIKLGFGELSPEEAQAQMEAMSTAAVAALREIYEAFSTILPPEVKAAIEAFLSSIEQKTKKTTKAAQDAAKAFSVMADSGRALLRLGDALGVISDELSNIAGGAIDALANLGQLASMKADGASMSAMLPSYIGVAAAAATIVAGFASSLGEDRQARRQEAKERGEETKRLTEALRDSARSIREAVQAVRGEAVRGSGITGEQRDLAGSAFQSFMDMFKGILPIAGGQTIGQAFTGLITYLENLDIPGIDFGAFRDQVNAMTGLGMSAQEAIGRVLAGGFQEIMDHILKTGEFGDNVSGAIEALRHFRRFLDDDLSAAFARFTDFLLSNVDGLTPALKALIEEASGLDLTDATGRARLREIIAMVAAASPEFLGGLRPSDLTAILEELLGFADGFTPAGNQEEFTRSVQIARSLTEIQANEFIAIADEQLFTMKRQGEELSRHTVLLSDLVRILGGTPPNFPSNEPYWKDGGGTGAIPLPPVLSSTLNRLSSTSSVPSSIQQMQNGTVVNVGVQVNVMKLDEQGIQQAGAALMAELRARAADPFRSSSR